MEWHYLSLLTYQDMTNQDMNNQVVQDYIYCIHMSTQYQLLIWIRLMVYTCIGGGKVIGQVLCVYLV